MNSAGGNRMAESRPKLKIGGRCFVQGSSSASGLRIASGFWHSSVRLFWGVLAFALLASARSRAESPAAAFDAANRLYEQGKFSEASAAYEKLLQSGRVSPALYYNLGNAYFKSGHMGRALLAYRQARELAPRDPDLRANLQFARNQVQGPTLAPDRLQAWLGHLTLNEWTLLAAACLWLWLLFLAVLQWRPKLTPVLKHYATALAVLAVLFCVGASAALYQARSNSTAIVIVHDTNARQSPFDESPTAFTLHDGAEVRVLDEKDDWLQVGVDSRRAGWLRRSQAALAPGA